MFNLFRMPFPFLSLSHGNLNNVKLLLRISPKTHLDPNLEHSIPIHIRLSSVHRSIRSCVKKIPGAVYLYSRYTAFGNYCINNIRKFTLKPDDKVDLFLNFSTVCNYNCVFCNRDVEPVIIRLSDVENLDELLSHANMVDITGYGEITAHPEFEKIIELFSAKGVKLRMVTNGSRLTATLIDKITQANFKEMVISLNSLNPETYPKIHGKNTRLERVLDNLKTLMAKKPNFPVRLSFVITSLNFNEIGDFLVFAKEKGFSSVTCLGLTPTLKDRYSDDLIVHNTEENRIYLNDMRTVAKNLGVVAALPYLENQQVGEEKIDPARLKKMVQGCDWVFSKMGIEPDGRVVPCCWSRVELGNIKIQSFSDIWYGEKYKELRKMVLRGDTTYCKNCRRL